MASGSFANIVSSYGLKSNGMNAMDVVNGIPVRINNYQGNATVYVYAKDKSTAEGIIGPMKDAAKNAGIMIPKVSGEAITFGFKKPRLAVDHYQKIREIITANAGVLNFDQCPYCFMGNCDIAGIYKMTSARRMHRQCYLNNRNNEMDKIQNSDGNYVTGIIGAIIAAILIVGLADLLVLGADRIFYILYLGFPLFIAGGYKMGKGPYGPMGSFCHVTISVLAMYVYFYIQGCYYASQWYGVSLFEAVPYFGEVMQIVLDPEFIKYSALEIILFVVGIIIVLVSNPSSKMQGAKEVQKNDVFITPLVTNNGFSGYDTYNPYSASGSQATQTYADPYGNQTSQYDQTSGTAGFGQQSTSADQNSSFGTSQDAFGSNNSWADAYGNGSSDNNNSGN